MPHLPGHNWIGPGTNIETAQNPIDNDDLIAEIHDKNYNKAKSPNDIQKYDKEAISDFGNDIIENKNIHSLIGASGLGIKCV